MSAHLKIRDLDAEMMKSLPDLVRGDAAVAVFIEEIERPDDLLWNALKVEKLPDEHLLKGGHGVERSGLTVEGSSSGNPRPSEVQSGSQVTSRPSSGNRTSPSSLSGSFAGKPPWVMRELLEYKSCSSASPILFMTGSKSNTSSRSKTSATPRSIARSLSHFLGSRLGSNSKRSSVT